MSASIIVYSIYLLTIVIRGCKEGDVVHIVVVHLEASPPHYRIEPINIIAILSRFTKKKTNSL